MPTLTDPQVLGLTIWAEARNQPIEGEIAVANVVKNRLKSGRWGTTLTAVCRAPYQFSCWLPAAPGDKNHVALLNAISDLLTGKQPGESLDECLVIADAVSGNHFRDNTKGSTHYLTRALLESAAAPAWVKGQQSVAVIGDHAFFNSIH